MRLRTLIPILGLMVLTLTTAACDPDIRAVGRTMERVGQEGKREIASMKQTGELEEDTAKKLTQFFHEAEMNGHGLTLIVNWKAMTPEGKRRTIVHQIELLEQSARRLDEAGALGIKSERARKKVENFQRNFQRGLGALRIIEAMLPPADEPAASQ